MTQKPINVVLIRPEIPGNTGNVGRTCDAAGASLHLVAPLGFSLSERRLKRAGMDYWDRLAPTVHDSLESFLAQISPSDSIIAFSSEATASFRDAPYTVGAWLVFGSESVGLPMDLRRRWADRLYRIPMIDGARSLNLSTSAALAVYEARRTLGLG